MKYDWVRDPFIQSNTQHLSVQEAEELIDIRNDRSLKLRHSEVSLETFWLELKDKFPCITKQSLRILLQFSTSYLCEIGFSSLTTIKNKKRSKLINVDHEMRVCLTNISPDILRICKSKQAQVSH